MSSVSLNFSPRMNGRNCPANRFVEDYPGAEIIGLNKNCRGTRTILDAASQVINAARTARTGERLYSEIDGEKTVSIISLFSVTAGSSNLADIERIRRSIHPGISRKTARQLKTWFLNNGLAITALRYTVRRFPVSGLTRSRQKRLYEFLGQIHTLQNEIKAMTVRDKLVHLAETSRLSSRLSENEETREAFHRLLDYSDLFGYDAFAFLGELALCRDTDTYREDAEKVPLMTMHAAKGLEFPVVFIAGCDHKRIPYCGNPGIPVDLDEERRLFYVAVTRAREKLKQSIKRKIDG